MTPHQTCPTCGALNKIAGLFDHGQLHGGPRYGTCTCCACGTTFTPREDGGVTATSTAAVTGTIDMRTVYRNGTIWLWHGGEVTT